MRKLRAYYTPTQTNRILVAKLERVPKIRDAYSFVPLAEELHERKPQLEEIAKSRKRTVFLWGDGHRHDESYWFTFTREMSNIEAKVNIDYHDDNNAGSRYLHHGNHMYYTQKNGMRIIIPEKIESYSDCSLKKPTRMERFLRRAKREGRKFGINEVALTIDLDGLVGLPVLEEWIYHNGLQPRQVVGLVRTLGTRIFRLDIGGLVEDMPDFDIVSVGEIPKPFEVMSYLDDVTKLTGEQQIKAIDLKITNFQSFCSSTTAQNVERTNDPKDKPLIDLVGSYTLDAYIKILGAYVDAIREN